MMLIAEEDFQLESCKDGKHWDLSVIKVVNANKANERKELSNFGYGLTLETALKRIAYYRIETKAPKDKIFTMKEYLTEFRKIVDSLRSDYLN